VNKNSFIGKILSGENMLRFKSLFRFLAVWFGIIVILSINSAAVSASEKAKIFVQIGHRGNVDSVVFSQDLF